MNKIIIIFALLFSVQSWADEIDPGVVTFCQNFSKLSGIANQITPTIQPAVSPLPPWGGIVVGLISRTSVVIDMCDFVISFSEWDTSQKINGSKRFINDLTGKKFDEDFDFADKTFNMANSVYDFDSGEQRNGSLFSEQSNRDMSQYMRDVQEYTASKTMTKAERAEQERQQQSDINAFSSIVAESKNLGDAINCPDSSNNPKYGDLYEKNIAPQEVIRKDAVDDENYFKDRLYELGRFMFAGSQVEFLVYRDDVDALDVQGAVLVADDPAPTYEEETTKPGKRKDKKGHPIPEKVKLTRTYENYKVVPNSEVYSRFKTKYSEKWHDAVKYEYLTKSTEFGVLAGADERVEKQFRNMSYECSEKKLMGNYDVNKSDYNAQYAKRQESCEASINTNEKKAANLFDYYTVQYENANYREKKTMAIEWSFESRYMGIHRAVVKKGNGSGFQAEDVKCSDNLEPADIKRLAGKQQDVESKYKEVIAKEKIKKNQRKGAISDNMKKYNEEQANKKNMVDKKMEDQRQQDKLNTGLTPSRTGIGGK